MKITIEHDGFKHSYEYSETDAPINTADLLYRTITLLSSVVEKSELINAYKDFDPALDL